MAWVNGGPFRCRCRAALRRSECPCLPRVDCYALPKRCAGLHSVLSRLLSPAVGPLPVLAAAVAAHGMCQICYIYAFQLGASQRTKLTGLIARVMLCVSYWLPAIQCHYTFAAAAVGCRSLAPALPRLALLLLACERWMVRVSQEGALLFGEVNQSMAISRAVAASEESFGIWPMEGCRFLLYNVWPEVRL